MKSRRPTEDQIAFLIAFGIVALPRSRSTASSLIAFICKGGPGFSRLRQAQRADYFKKVHRTWNGKRVRRKNSQKAGTVQYVFCMRPETRTMSLKILSDPGPPFRAMVRWDGERARHSTLSMLELVE